MIATTALIAALLLVAAALYRMATTAPAGLRHIQLILALAAGLLGIAAWRATGDSRWLVGGVLLIGAAVPGWVAGRRRGVAIAALILGVLGAALYAVATANPAVTLTRVA